MQLSGSPTRIKLPFANAGSKNTIPLASQIGIVDGAASLTDGFPPLNRTPLATGGVPPSGLDMNGILYELSALVRWLSVGAGYVYDGAYAADANVAGYPKGARVLRSDGAGYWLNTADSNTVDPESSGSAAAGWVPDATYGITAVTMTSSHVTLTPLQYGKPTIVITGALSANINLIFPPIAGEWKVIKNTTGNFTITLKTAAGTGFAAGPIQTIICDTVNILNMVDSLGLVPPGTVAHYAGTSPPAGWLKRNGAAVSRSTYAALYAVIGVTFGAGDGSTTFNVPDSRSDFDRGFDDGRGLFPSQIFGSEVSDSIRSHDHAIAYSQLAGGSGTIADITGIGHAVSTAATGGAETAPRHGIFLAIIKY